jgi:glucokinase
MTMKTILGFDIGGTKCAVSIGKGTLEPGREAIDVIDRVFFPTAECKTPEETVDRACREMKMLIEKYGENNIESVGISCGGPLDGKKGMVLSPPNLPGWDEFPVVRLVEEKTGIKAKLSNDADACALAEWKFGAGKGCKNMVFLTFGTGFGAGLILNGALYTGANNMAGEIGHIRLERFGPVGYGKSGSAEGFCSGGGIARLAQSMALERFQKGEKVSFCEGLDRLDEITAKSVAMAAFEGDELALEVYRISGEYLGRSLSILIDLLNPEKIVIGGVFARSKDLLWSYAKKVIEEETLYRSASVCSVVPAALGEKVGDYSALTVALYEDF